MSLPPVLRSLLLNGPWGPSHYDPLRYGGAAVVRAAWGRHRAELIAACKPGTRPWALWRIELGIPKPAGEAGQLRAIPHLGLYRDDAERAYVTGASMRSCRRSEPLGHGAGKPQAVGTAAWSDALRD